MLPLDTLLVFFSASLVLGIMPGPDNLFVLSQSISYGTRAGLLVVVGLCTGLVFHTGLVAAGVGALIVASPQLFTLVKSLGAAYLLYLAWQNWKTGEQVQGMQEVASLNGLQLYRRGIIMNATNPKVTIFFLAFLPQFIDQNQASVVGQVVVLGVLFVVATLLVFGSIALVAGRLSAVLQQSTRQIVWLHRVMAVFFVGLAVNLFVDWF